MFNSNIQNMFLGDFDNMIKNDIGLENFNIMKNEIVNISMTNEGITEYKNKVSDWLVKNDFCAF